MLVVFHLIDVKNPAIGKTFASLAAVGVDGVQFGVHGADVDDLLARRAGLRCGSLPIGDAAGFQIRLRNGLEHRMGVIGPLDLAGIGCNRENAIERR